MLEPSEPPVKRGLSLADRLRKLNPFYLWGLLHQAEQDLSLNAASLEGAIHRDRLIRDEHARHRAIMDRILRGEAMPPSGPWGDRSGQGPL